MDASAGASYEDCPSLPSLPPSYSTLDSTTFLTSSTQDVTHVNGICSAPKLLPQSSLCFSPSSSSRLGTGSSGSVFRGSLHSSPVAFKACTDTPLAEAQFSREARRLHALRHPNIISIYGLAEIVTPATRPAHLALVTELCNGGSLHHALIQVADSQRPTVAAGLPRCSALQISAHVAGALSCLHAECLTHGDLKPLNILLTHALAEDGTAPDGFAAKLCDFGLSRRLGYRRAVAEVGTDGYTGVGASTDVGSTANVNTTAKVGTTADVCTTADIDSTANVGDTDSADTADTADTDDVGDTADAVGNTPVTSQDPDPEPSALSPRPNVATSASIAEVPSPQPPARPFHLRKPSADSAGDLNPDAGARGTYEYLAPECFGTAPASSSADIFAFGMVLYQMLTLQSPWPGLNAWAIFSRVVRRKQRPPWPATDIVPELQELVELCWAQDPDDRPTAQEVYARLRHLAAEPVRVANGDSTMPSFPSCPVGEHESAGYMAGPDCVEVASYDSDSEETWGQRAREVDDSGSQTPRSSNFSASSSICYDSEFSTSCSASTAPGDTVDSMLDGLGIRHVNSQKLPSLHSIVEYDFPLKDRTGENGKSATLHGKRRRRRLGADECQVGPVERHKWYDDGDGNGADLGTDGEAASGVDPTDLQDQELHSFARSSFGEKMVSRKSAEEQVPLQSQVRRTVDDLSLFALIEETSLYADDDELAALVGITAEKLFPLSRPGSSRSLSASVPRVVATSENISGPASGAMSLLQSKSLDATRPALSDLNRCDGGTVAQKKCFGTSGVNDFVTNSGLSSAVISDQEIETELSQLSIKCEDLWPNFQAA